VNFRPKTILVLGAGASKDFGLPLGTDLRLIIESTLDIRFDEWGSQLKVGSPVMVEAFRQLASSTAPQININSYLHASREISAAMPLCSSIDDYLEKHQGQGLYEICGKLAIAKSILEAEKNSNILTRRDGTADFNPSKMSESWMTSFMQTATRGVRRAQINSAFDELLVVNFNYDRCFEIFAYGWLQAAYRLTDAEAEDIVTSIKMIRPYGSLGPLGWQHSKGVGFGATASAQQLLDICSKIKTYSESVNEDKTIEKIGEYLVESRCIVFLGFAFHRQNMRFFDVSSERGTFSRHVYACTHGIPDPKWNLIKTNLADLLKISRKQLVIESLKGDCREFWNEYGDNIAA
jgi:hypothetical protein